MKAKSNLRIVIDDKIPYIRETIETITDRAVYLPGAAISREDVADADAMIVRTRTRCDAALLEGSSVGFVATATIGFDHIDADFMQRAGIRWMSCPGCNSSSVAQYLRSVMILLRREKGMALKGMTMGIVGCGHVGSKVAEEARKEGMRVIICDPPLAERGMGDGFVTLDTICNESDVITFHVPLTRCGDHPTYHMADRELFAKMKRKPVIINTSRGAVVDNAALVEAIDEGRVSLAVIDTWENEPHINADLLERAWIATPHIAGYSADGKVNADNMVIEGLCRHFSLPLPERIEAPALPDDFVFPDGDDELHLALYNPLDDCKRLKAAPEDFEKQRGNYPLRREKR